LETQTRDLFRNQGSFLALCIQSPGWRDEMAMICETLGEIQHRLVIAEIPIPLIFAASSLWKEQCPSERSKVVVSEGGTMSSSPHVQVGWTDHWDLEAMVLVANHRHLYDTIRSGSSWINPRNMIIPVTREISMRRLVVS
jgi:hypothetical protein